MMNDMSPVSSTSDKSPRDTVDTGNGHVTSSGPRTPPEPQRYQSPERDEHEGDENKQDKEDSDDDFDDLDLPAPVFA